MTRDEALARATTYASEIADRNEKGGGGYQEGYSREKYIKDYVDKNVVDTWLSQNKSWDGPQVTTSSKPPVSPPVTSTGLQAPQSPSSGGITYGYDSHGQPTSPAPVDGLKSISPENFPVLYGSGSTPAPPTQTEQIAQSTQNPNYPSYSQPPSTDQPTDTSHEDQLKPTQNPNNNISNAQDFSGNLWKQSGYNTQSASRQQMQQMAGSAVDGLRSLRTGTLY